jgi:cytochrome c5
MNTIRRRRWFRLAALTALALITVAGLGLAQQEDEAAKKARLKKLDAGPKKVDVAKYPKDMQAGYALFTKKCAKCHTTARPINSRFVLPGEWERYIKRMVYKPDSKMTDDDGKTIYRFLVYDSSVRKADSLRVHLANLSHEEREAAVTKIKALNPSFDPSGK